ncbi:MAG: hypothetical protein ACREXW_15155 [Gammaproteobacteria bacterium]
MTPTIHSHAVMAAMGHIGGAVAERPLLALSLAAALAFVLGCARPPEKEADDTTIEAPVAARRAAPSPSAKAPALPPPFHRMVNLTTLAPGAPLPRPGCRPVGAEWPG